MYCHSRINCLRKKQILSRGFTVPYFNTELYKYSLIAISIKLLNSQFLIDDQLFRSILELSILFLYKANFKHWT